MRLLCRIGIHKWSSWSGYWWADSTREFAGKLTEKRRSLKCQCCGWIKTVELGRYERHDMNPRKPIWNEEKEH